MRKIKSNADAWDRTRDLQIFSLTLSQLSYVGDALLKSRPACADLVLLSHARVRKQKTKSKNDWSGIRTHASEETSALNWRLRPLGHPTANVPTTLLACINSPLLSDGL